MKALSFSSRLKAGWNKEKLMKYYSLDEKQYEKVLGSLERIKIEGERNKSMPLLVRIQK